jgi:hypothetical protein
MIGFWQLVDLGGFEPGADARAYAEQQVSDVVSTAGLACGPLSPRQARDVGKRLSTRLLECLKAQLTPYDADLLIPALIGQNELLSATASFIEDDLARPADEMSLPLPASVLSGAISSMANISIRFLVELTAAQPPNGVRNPDASDVQRLWGLADTLLEVGTMRDAVPIAISDSAAALRREA